MESPTSHRDRPANGVAQLAVPPRAPLAERNREARRAARERVAARTTNPITPEQRDNDPLARGRRTATGRLLRVLGSLAGSTAVHAGIVGLGFVLAGMNLGTRQAFRQQVDIVMLEHVPPPPPPPPEEKPPEPERVVKRPSRPPPVAQPEPPPPDHTPAPPPRVVGLSLDSISERGGGPSFAVGNTREGKTAERAVDPNQVPKEAPPEAAPLAPNQAASRIPTAGVVYGQPKRKNPSLPPYPDILKAQGIEADVTVMVRLSAAGKVEEVKIIKAATYPEFNEAARAHALTEQYEPATRDGEPIAYSFSFTYRFRLQPE